MLSFEQLRSSKLNYKLVWRPIIFRTLPVLGVFFLGISRVERLSGIHLGWYWFLMFSMVDWKCDFTPRTSYAMASWFMSRSHITLHVKFYFRTTAKSHIVNTDKIPLNVQHIHFIDLISSNSNMILLSSSGTSFTHQKNWDRLSVVPWWSINNPSILWKVNFSQLKGWSKDYAH